MAALDTNILVRWLTNDDVQQCAEVSKLFAQVIRSSERLYITTTVILELEWVLRARYGFEKANVMAAWSALLDTTEIVLQDESALERALWLFKQSGVRDFADCLHVALAMQAGQGPLLTFDERAAKIDGAQLLGNHSPHCLG